jgi:hypothetical protein
VNIAPYLVALHTQRVHSVAGTVAAIHPDAGYVELGSILRSLAGCGPREL